ncbi:MAG: GGDEF domain-containing protein, partial [Candidatus Falkowbacteria bacterium]|nr:GGDEF domain-containing protein [Candidatus Falkowbacteria bacterium]
GGDEFSVLLCGCSMEGAIIVAERIIERLKMPFPIAGHICQIGASIGIAVFNNTEDVASLVNRADQAMYTAKEAGKNCYRIATFQEYE